jgi:hypothetical protein
MKNEVLVIEALKPIKLTRHPHTEPSVLLINLLIELHLPAFLGGSLLC